MRMDLKNLARLRQLKINQPCHEDWNEMKGDEKRRFCGGCGCYVNNISEFDAGEAENLLNQTGRVCTRVISDPHRGILTKDGWVARVLTAGAVAVAMAGCAEEPVFIGEAAGSQPKPVVDDGKNVPTGPTNPTPPIMGEIAVPQQEPEIMTGIVAPADPVPPATEPDVTIGRVANPQALMGEVFDARLEPTLGKVVNPEMGTPPAYPPK